MARSRKETKIYSRTGLRDITACSMMLDVFDQLSEPARAGYMAALVTLARRFPSISHDVLVGNFMQQIGKVEKVSFEIADDGHVIVVRHAKSKVSKVQARRIYESVRGT